MEHSKSKHKKNVYLSFRLGKETFAVSVRKVLEVLQKQHITEVPDVPPHIKGVINFRGDILPICDTRMKFRMDNQVDHDKNVIIVLDLVHEDNKYRVGAIADAVKDVIAVEDTDIKPVPEMRFKYDLEFLNGMIKNGDGFILVLNVDKIFTTNEVSIINETQANQK